LQKHHLERVQGVLLNSIHPDLKRIFEYQWLRLQNIEDEDFKYMVKRILLCDWEGNITSKMDFGENVNYTKEQILERNGLRKTDEIIQKWMQIL
jgi:hypothetical protein